MARSVLTLADVIDLEHQLELDRAVDAESLHARDRAIGLTLPEPPTSAAGQLRHWLDALRALEPERPWLGAAALRGARLLCAGLVVLGLSLGAGTARVLLHFEGPRPVNTLPVLGILVLLQIALLILVLTSLVLSAWLPSWVRNLPLVGDLRALLRSVAGWLGARGRGTGAAGTRFIASLHRLRARSRLHAALELWWMTLTAQGFGIGFNLGALAMLALLPVVLKYSFCWSTTLSLGPAALHQITTALSFPWHAVLPAAVPSRQLIDSTQFDLFTRAYSVDGAPASGPWWPFLLACVVGYGLLPRVALAIVAGLRLRSALVHLPLDTPEVEALLRRLRLPRVETRGLAQAAGAAPGVALPLGAQVSPHETGACAVVAWRDLPLDRAGLEAWLQAQLGWSARGYYCAGGADFEADRKTIEQAATARSPVVVVAEAWEPPDKAVRRFLTSLRAAIGARTKLAVVLIPGAAASAPKEHEVETWSLQLAALEDPYLSVQRMGA